LAAVGRPGNASRIGVLVDPTSPSGVVLGRSHGTELHSIGTSLPLLGEHPADLAAVLTVGPNWAVRRAGWWGGDDERPLTATHSLRVEVPVVLAIDNGVYRHP
jgi:hypothetical protein